MYVLLLFIGFNLNLPLDESGSTESGTMSMESGSTESGTLSMESGTMSTESDTSSSMPKASTVSSTTEPGISSATTDSDEAATSCCDERVGKRVASMRCAASGERDVLLRQACRQASGERAASGDRAASGHRVASSQHAASGEHDHRQGSHQWTTKNAEEDGDEPVQSHGGIKEEAARVLSFECWARTDECMHVLMLRRS